MSRFKIDFTEYASIPFALYAARRRWHTWFTGSVRWEQVQLCETREKAKERYEQIKDLPEYLD